MFWISGVALFCVHVLGVSVAAGWNIVGVLGVLAVLGGLIAVHEIRHAPDLTARSKPSGTKSAYGMAWSKEAAGSPRWVTPRQS